MTKEELLEQNVKLEIDNHSFLNKEQYLRKEFAKAFNWYDIYRDKYTQAENKAIQTPSWEEIFVEVGKLLSKQSTLKIRDGLEKAELSINSLFQLINDLQNN